MKIVNDAPRDVERLAVLLSRVPIDMIVELVLDEPDARQLVGHIGAVEIDTGYVTLHAGVNHRVRIDEIAEVVFA